MAADTARDGSPASEREFADTVGVVRSSTGDAAPSTPARALFEMSPTMASRPGASAPERPTDLAAGTLLDDSYRVLSVLGRGGMGTVYLVEHTKLGRRFAAKVIADHLAADAVLVSRLHAEARVASRLRHENIVDVTHLGQTSTGALFIVMELLEGRDLRALLDDEGRQTGLPFALVRTLAEDLFAALSAAHAQGVVHRDLKPENVFLTTTERGPRAKIVDFGIAKSGPDEDLGLTQTGQVIGTPLYMSPEQARDTSGVDARSDQYSLGIVLFELLTGKLPFEAKNAYELVVMHATERPRPLRLLRPELPAAVEAVVLRCLEKAPDARFADVGALREAWRSAWNASGEAGTAAQSGSSAQEGAAQSGSSARVSAAHPGSSAVPTGPRGGSAKGLAMSAGAVAVLVLGIGLAWTLRAPSSGASTPVVDLGPDAAVPSPDAATAADAYELPRAAEPPPEVRTIRSRPEGATLRTIDGTTCTTPCDLTLPVGGSLDVTLTLRGHRSVSRTVSRDDAPELTITMTPTQPRSGPPELAPR